MALEFLNSQHTQQLQQCGTQPLVHHITSIFVLFNFIFLALLSPDSPETPVSPGAFNEQTIRTAKCQPSDTYILPRIHTCTRVHARAHTRTHIHKCTHTNVLCEDRNHAASSARPLATGEARRARKTVHSWRDDPGSRSPFWKPRQVFFYSCVRELVMLLLRTAKIW